MSSTGDGEALGEVRPAAPRTRGWVRDLLIICLGLKILLFFLGLSLTEIRLNRGLRTTELAFAIWNQWDSRHYIDVAANGYGPPGEKTNLVLPPLLSTLVRVGSWFTGSYGLSGIIVATVLSFLPGWLLFRLARLDLDDEAAFRAALILLFFPSGFFLHLLYTESLFLATVLATFLSARHGNWRGVAWFGLLAGLTRINAFVLAPALLFEAWGESSKGRATRVAASMFVGVGIAIYLAINYVVGGDPFAFVAVQRDAFYRTFAWPWDGATAVYRLAQIGGSDSMMNGVYQFLCIPPLIYACAVALRRQRPSYAVWMIGNVLVFTAQGFWLSLPRLMIVLFPAFIWLAPRTAHRVFGPLWFAGSVLFLGLLTCQFAQGWWVS